MIIQLLVLCVLYLTQVSCGDSKREEIRNARIVSCWQGSHIDIETRGMVRKLVWNKNQRRLGVDCIVWGEDGSRWTIVVEEVEDLNGCCYRFVEARKEDGQS